MVEVDQGGVRGSGVKASRRRVDLLDAFMDLVWKLALESRCGTPIIVEGKRDAESLRRLGVRGEIILLRSIRGVRRLFEGREVGRVILLMDLDREGERAMKLVKKSLEGVVGEVDTSYWRRLHAFKSLGFTQIENLHRIPEKILPRNSHP
ncbi:MAG: hypothetical protein DRN64_02455 [Thaumarchaeota archaeon]|nr:MAG: hypothetical protein DRN64_02455 [Nitrososphaerota archaeon]